VPLVFRWNGYRFHFFSNEGDPREPVHVHVTRSPATAKFWLRPEVALAYNRGFPPRVLSELVSVIESRADEIERAWNDHFA
jgi:hypothetical protein